MPTADRCNLAKPVFEPGAKTWEKNAVRVSAIGDVFKVWAWGLGSLIVALALTPIAFNGGKALWELSPSKDFNAVVNYAAVWSGAAELVDFFEVCWILVALVLLFPMMEWLRLGGRGGGQPIRAGRRGALHVLCGFLMSFVGLFLIGCAMLEAGTFLRIADFNVWRTAMISDVLWVFAIAAVNEIFFRIVLLGIFLRAMKPWLAIALAAAMSGGIAFVFSGFGSVKSFDGEAVSAMELAGALFGGGNMWERVAIVFLPWFAFGCVLGWARWRTASLWLPVGLMMGWLLAERLFLQAAHPVVMTDRVAGYFSAGSLHAGIIPLIGVLAVGGLVHLITQGSRHESNACE